MYILTKGIVMLNLKTYLPSTESFDSLPETLQSDVSSDGENTYVSGIPEELIKPMENSTQTNEDDNVITDVLQKQKHAEDTEENFEESEQKKFDEEHPKEEDTSTEVDLGAGDENAGTDEPVEGDEEDQIDDSERSEDNTADEESEDESETDEESTTDVNYAIESYRDLLTNEESPLTHQSAAFLLVGLNRLQKQCSVTTISNETFVTGPSAVHRSIDSKHFIELLDNLTVKS